MSPMVDNPDRVAGDASLLEAALAYAQRGWPVFPVYSLGAEGLCTCGNPECTSPGKHPRTAHGLDDATTDEARIREHWTRWPEANVGVVTGRVSGLLVLDIDPRHGGDDSLEELKRRCGGTLPETVEALTGGGGRHLLFRHPDQEIRCAAGVGGLAGIDVLNTGVRHWAVQHLGVQHTRLLNISGEGWLPLHQFDSIHLLFRLTNAAPCLSLWGQLDTGHQACLGRDTHAGWTGEGLTGARDLIVLTRQPFRRRRDRGGSWHTPIYWRDSLTTQDCRSTQHGLDWF